VLLIQQKKWLVLKLKEAPELNEVVFFHFKNLDDTLVYNKSMW
jgi:hypothetical protein